MTQTVEITDFIRRCSAEAALPAMKLFQSQVQIHFVKVGPHPVRKQEFGIGRFPQQKIRQTFLSARANQQINLSTCCDQSLGRALAALNRADDDLSPEKIAIAPAAARAIASRDE